jgi:hypothetical protein
MYKDTVEILSFVLQVLKENDKTAFKGHGVYDIYRQFYRVVRAADHILIHYLQKRFDDMSTSTFKSVEEKWIYFNNKNLRGYEAARHKLLVMLWAIQSEDANHKYDSIFSNNFLSKSLSGRIDEYTTVSKIDDDFQLTMYHFNFVTDVEKVSPFRSFEELFSKVVFDLSDQEKRDRLVKETKKQIDDIHDLLKEYEAIMLDYYTIGDLFLEDERKWRF